MWKNKKAHVFIQLMYFPSLHLLMEASTFHVSIAVMFARPNLPLCSISTLPYSNESTKTS